MAAKTANILARVEPDVKEQAEAIMAQIGVPASVVINMLYKQIIMKKAIPFPLTVVNVPVARDEMTKEDFDKDMSLGLQQAQANNSRVVREVFDEIRQEIK